ncbi:MAG: uroporphyrinogen-III synthase, partial [Pseudomonadota bacterium]
HLQRMLAGMTETVRVIITRPEPDASAFAGLARARGLIPVLSPAMEIVIDRKTLDLSTAGALAFTSANGVRAFAANCDRRDLPVYAVGAMTAAAARERGFSRIETASGDVMALADLISEQDEPPRILHVAGKSRAGDLSALLAERGVAASRSVLYRADAVTAPSADAMAMINAHSGDRWVALFSPRTAGIFLDQLRHIGASEKVRSLHAACLSDAVAARLDAAPFASISVAASTDSAAVLDVIGK